MTKFEKRTNHRLSTERLNVMNEKQQFTQTAPQQRMQNDAHCPITSMMCTVQLMLKSGC